MTEAEELLAQSVTVAEGCAYALSVGRVDEARALAQQYRQMRERYRGLANPGYRLPR